MIWLIDTKTKTADDTKPIVEIRDCKPEFIEKVKCITHPIRIDLINLLILKGRVMLTDFYELAKVKYPTSIISQHLMMLKLSGIVKTERIGNYFELYLEKESIVQLIEFISIAQCEVEYRSINSVDFNEFDDGWHFEFGIDDFEEAMKNILEKIKTD